jgi:hypothetical protein
MTIQVANINCVNLSDYTFNIPEFSRMLDEYSTTLDENQYIDPAEFAIRVLRAYGLIGELVPIVLLNKMAGDVKKTHEYPPLVINTIEFALSFCVLARSRSAGIVEEELEPLKDKMNENWTAVKNILDSMPEAE